MWKLLPDRVATAFVVCHSSELYKHAQLPFRHTLWGARWDFSTVPTPKREGGSNCVGVKSDRRHIGAGKWATLRLFPFTNRGMQIYMWDLNLFQGHPGVLLAPYKMKNDAQRVLFIYSASSQPAPCHYCPYLELERAADRSGKEKTRWCNNCSDKLYFITDKHFQAIKAYLDSGFQNFWIKAIN